MKIIIIWIAVVYGIFVCIDVFGDGRCSTTEYYEGWKTIQHVEKVYSFFGGTNFIIRYTDNHYEEIDAYRYGGEVIGDNRYVRWTTTHECGCKRLFAFWLKEREDACP